MSEHLKSTQEVLDRNPVSGQLIFSLTVIYAVGNKSSNHFLFIFLVLSQ